MTCTLLVTVTKRKFTGEIVTAVTDGLWHAVITDIIIIVA